jgi:hypothetical protein
LLSITKLLQLRIVFNTATASASWASGGAWVSSWGAPHLPNICRWMILFRLRMLRHRIKHARNRLIIDDVHEKPAELIKAGGRKLRTCLICGDL